MQQRLVALVGVAERSRELGRLSLVGGDAIRPRALGDRCELVELGVDLVLELRRCRLFDAHVHIERGARRERDRGYAERERG